MATVDVASSRLEARIRAIEAECVTLQCMLGIVIAGVVALIARAFFA